MGASGVEDGKAVSAEEIQNATAQSIAIKTSHGLQWMARLLLCVWAFGVENDDSRCIISNDLWLNICFEGLR